MFVFNYRLDALCISVPNVAREAEVVSVASGRWDNGQRIITELEVGNKVLIQPYGGTQVDVEGESMLVVSETDILAIL